MINVCSDYDESLCTSSFFFFLFEENKYLHGCLAHVCANTEQTSQLAVKTDTYTTS